MKMYMTKEREQIAESHMWMRENKNIYDKRAKAGRRKSYMDGKTQKYI